MSDMKSVSGRRTMPIPDTVIAKYAPWGLGVSLTAFLMILGLCWSTILRHPAGTTWLANAWATDKTMVLVNFFYTPLAVWYMSSVLRQVIYHGGRAIWIENGNLRYLAYRSTSFSSVPLGDIRDLSIERRVLQPTRIAVRSEQGVALITTLFLSVPADVIRARLVEALALPKTS